MNEKRTPGPEENLPKGDDMAVEPASGAEKKLYGPEAALDPDRRAAAIEATSEITGYSLPELIEAYANTFGEELTPEDLFLEIFDYSGEKFDESELAGMSLEEWIEVFKEGLLIASQIIGISLSGSEDLSFSDAELMIIPPHADSMRLKGTDHLAVFDDITHPPGQYREIFYILWDFKDYPDLKSLPIKIDSEVLRFNYDGTVMHEGRVIGYFVPLHTVERAEKVQQYRETLGDKKKLEVLEHEVEKLRNKNKTGSILLYILENPEES